MKYSARKELMKVFRLSGGPINSEQIFAIAKKWGLFIPSAFNTHLSQMNKMGVIERVKRATYQIKE